MDLPAALLARPLGYLDAQSVMIVSTLNTQYRAVVCGSEMEGGLLRSQIYLRAMKAELRNAKKELTEAEDRRIIELRAYRDNSHRQAEDRIVRKKSTQFVPN